MRKPRSDSLTNLPSIDRLFSKYLLSDNHFQWWAAEQDGGLTLRSAHALMRKTIQDGCICGTKEFQVASFKGNKKKYKAQFGAGGGSRGPGFNAQHQNGKPKCSQKKRHMPSLGASHLPGRAVPCPVFLQHSSGLFKGYFPHRAFFTGLLQPWAMLRTALKSVVQHLANLVLYGSLELISMVAKQDAVTTH